MVWDEYREACKKWRMDLDTVEYIAVLLLGIREEFDEFMQERKNCNLDAQLDEYGDLLFNIADLVNVLEENYSHFRGNSTDDFHAPNRCVEVVRKYYMRDKNELRFIGEAWKIAERCILDYVYSTGITAEDSMNRSFIKLEERHG